MKTARIFVRSLALLLVVPFASVAVPRDALPLDAPELPASYRLHVEFSAPAAGVVRLGKDLAVPLPKGVEHDVAVERPAKGAPVVRVWTDGKVVDVKPAGAASAASAFPEAKVNLGADFTAAVKFEAQGGAELPAHGSYPHGTLSLVATAAGQRCRWGK